MDMMKSKKGVFFTYIAVVFIALLILTAAVEKEGKLRGRSFIIETRMQTMNTFVNNVDNDIERGMNIASFRALLGMADYVAGGSYLNDTSAAFTELVINGTLYGGESAIMTNNTFINWTEKMKAEAQKIDILLNFSVSNISIYHVSPFYVGVDAYVYYNLTDTKGMASWRREKSITTRVYIDGFEDPVYIMNTNGYLHSFIIVSNIADYVSGNDTTNLQIYANGSYYTPWTGAPSYLMRLEGNLNASVYGIESIIDGQDLIDLDALYPEIEPNFYQASRSMVDYIYWGFPSTEDSGISNMPSWFRLDNESNGSLTHIEKYEVEDLVI